jgi:hypothetical protein
MTIQELLLHIDTKGIPLDGEVLLLNEAGLYHELAFLQLDDLAETDPAYPHYPADSLVLSPADH